MNYKLMNSSINNIIIQQRSKILSLVKERVVLNQDVFYNTIKVFSKFKEKSKSILDDLKNRVLSIDRRIVIQQLEINRFAYQLKIAGNVLEFFMHTNVFRIEKTSPLYKSPYLKQNPSNACCGIIYVYNFMSDSFKFNRLSDIGTLLARIFINRENHFFIETKLPLAAKYSNFSLEPISDSVIEEIINDFIISAIEIDMIIPSFDTVKEISVNEINERTGWITLRIGKRLGFESSRTNSDEDISFQL